MGNNSHFHNVDHHDVLKIVRRVLEEDREIKATGFEDNIWYAYLHEDDTIHTKRFHDWGDYKEVGDSPFVTMVTGLFEANNKLDADLIGTGKLRRVRTHGST